MRHLFAIAIILLTMFHGWCQHQEGFIPINDGKLYYEMDGSGPPLLFLHGVCLDHRMWKEQITFFSKTYTCINLDLRGFGKSSLPTDIPYSFHEDIRILLDSLHINRPVVLIALSMGGKAAVNFALTYEQMTKAMVLADVAVDGYQFRDFKLERIAEVARVYGSDSSNRYFLDNPIFSTAKKDSSVFDPLRRMILSYSGWQWLHKNPILGLTPPAIDQLGKIKVPVLVITGENDIWDFQKIAENLHADIKNSKRYKIAGAGHMCNMEKPKEFNRLLSDFFSSLK